MTLPALRSLLSAPVRFLLAASLALPLIASAADAPPKGVNWFKGDVDAAFVQARAQNKPLFLYWGAVWCPYCNQVKATIFTRQAFIERSRHFIPVYLDGDAPSAQKHGARFKVRGYPTMILFKPDGSEILRLPGEIDANRYLQVLALGMSASARPAKETLAAALANPSSLKDDEWRLLAFYSWDQGEQSLIAEHAVAPTLAKLAATVPASAGEAAVRLDLASLVAAAGAKPAEQPAIDKAAALARVQKLVGDAKAVRDYADVFANQSAKLLTFLTAAGTPERAAFKQSLDALLRRQVADASLSRTDRMYALAELAAVARVETPTGPLDDGLVKLIRASVADADKATKDVHERQPVVYNASTALNNAGLLDDSDALLKAELKKSIAPYYFMNGLAANAKKRGDAKAALDWYEQAYAASKGPATRLRWGANYALNLLEIGQTEDERIEKAVSSIITELADTKDAFYEGSLVRLQRLGARLHAWDKDGLHGDVYPRLKAQLDAVCAKLPADDPQRASCSALFKPRG